MSALKITTLVAQGLPLLMDLTPRLQAIENNLLSAAPNPDAAIATIDSIDAESATFLTFAESVAAADGAVGELVGSLIVKVLAEKDELRLAVNLKTAITGVVGQS